MTIYDINILPDSAIVPVSTVNMASLSNDIRIGLTPDLGTLVATVDTGLVLEIVTTDETPKWVELSWVGGREQLCNHGHITLRLSASSTDDSWVHPVLRLHKADGFHDMFAPERLTLTPSPVVHEVSYTLTPRDLDGCTAVDLHLFFEPRENSVALHSLCLTAFK